MTDSQSTSGVSSAALVVGVVPGQPPAVVATAAQVAARYSAELVCGYVDAGRYPIVRADGTTDAQSIDPDLALDPPVLFDEALTREIAVVLAALPAGSPGSGIRWSMRFLSGDPAHALAGLADELDAAMIVVGTRDATMRASIAEFFGGSVAVHLAHRQHRPVLVVPLDPQPPEAGWPGPADPTGGVGGGAADAASRPTGSEQA
ncbi:universal stress protein [Herbiconiux sp. CPCC 205763]|uniref:Universal stress protein n=1 Tax=Herbiconiux aconitum TaxID=2970913 RepID=A0ABT2GM82_9MICO|nr:universal stress protein [Herbiconiux aconitum]MCS5717337.1 universal stress protein [Herbiconiux aconitum]